MTSSRAEARRCTWLGRGVKPWGSSPAVSRADALTLSPPASSTSQARGSRLVITGSAASASSSLATGSLATGSDDRLATKASNPITSRVVATSSAAVLRMANVELMFL